MSRRRRSKEFKNNSQVIDIEEARQKRQARRKAEKEKEKKKAENTARRKTRGKMAIRRSRNRRRFLVGLIVVFIGVLIALSLINIISLKKEQHDVREQKEQLNSEKEQLTEELEDINDLSNLEEQAREQLKLIKKGEKIYIFPEEITKNDSQDETEEE